MARIFKLMTEHEEQQDREFLADILFRIRDYARDNGIDEDETIRTVAENMLALLEVATFKGTEGKECK